MALGLFKRNKGAETAEMSFMDHLEDLRAHLFRSVVAIAIGAVVAGIYNKVIIEKILLGPVNADFPTYGFICKLGKYLHLGEALCMSGIGIKMQSTEVASQFSTWFTVILVSGLILAFPYVFLQFWKFVKPALTKKELKNTRGVIFWVSFLFFLGVLFGYFVVAPYALNFFGNFKLDPRIENIWTIGSYLDMMLPLVLGSGLAFQLPLVMYFLAQIGIVSATYLRKVWKYALVVIFIVAGVITPGPDVVSQMAVALPLLLLYQISIILCSRVEKRKKREEEAEWS